MKKLLYHGSSHIVGAPVYGKGATTNDYGRGFYCTHDKELAKEWACSTQQDGYVNCYELDLDDLALIRLQAPTYNILNWLALLTQHRTYWQNSQVSEAAKAYLREEFLPDISDADVIIGYRADDSYFSFAQDFVSGSISVEVLSRAMRLGNLGNQTVLKSEKAFSKLHYLGFEPVDASVYYAKRMLREREARSAYRKSKMEVDLNGLFIIDIIREGIKNGDSRLF